MNVISYILLAVVILMALAAVRHLRAGGGKKSCCQGCNGKCQGCSCCR
ncbi:MAG: hypothetical protein IJV60_04735 [Prevotella sp.]|nr:hypothetical protein [Prevotella sp.]MBQ8058211.1 hypothetical protein [Prevotella sp.]